jgi:predicted DCC family thiol-disulfide oxidoreductase YuxK
VPRRRGYNPGMVRRLAHSPSRPVLIYDGGCPFCRKQVDRLLRWARPGAIETLSLLDPELPERFPGLSHEALLEAMHLVDTHGRVFVGAEAAVRSLASRPVLGRLALVYYVPGVRLLADTVYRWIARRRRRDEDCPEGTCGTHHRPS